MTFPHISRGVITVDGIEEVISRVSMWSEHASVLITSTGSP